MRTAQMATNLQRVIRSTLSLVLGLDFMGRQVERRYFRLGEIQDGGRGPF